MSNPDAGLPEHRQTKQTQSCGTGLPDPDPDHKDPFSSPPGFSRSGEDQVGGAGRSRFTGRSADPFLTGCLKSPWDKDDGARVKAGPERRWRRFCWV